jgi:hypothetical protein
MAAAMSIGDSESETGLLAAVVARIYAICDGIAFLRSLDALIARP